MNLTQDHEDNEQLVVIYNDSHVFTRTDILELLKANIGQDDPYYPFKQLLETMNVKVDQQRRVLLCDTQARGQEWDLDAVDRVIHDLRHQPPTSAAKTLVSVQREEEAKLSLNEEDLSNSDISAGDPSPSAVFDLAREHFQFTSLKNPADIPTIFTEHTANHEPPIPVRQAETEPAILAHCSFALAEPFASSFYTLNPALQSMMFDGTQGTYYEQIPHFDGLGTSDSSSEADGRNNDGGEGGSFTEGG